MSATINAALCQRLIRRKTVYTRQSGLNGSETRIPTQKTERTRFVHPKSLYITRFEKAFSAAC
jgi:hypothetical protein